MKQFTLFILLPLALSIAALPSFPEMTAHRDNVEFGALDICHPAAPALSSNGDMQYTHALQRQQSSPSYQGIAVMMEIPSQQILIVFPFERPPEA
jgi:hypothetical protein